MTDIIERAEALLALHRLCITRPISERGLEGEADLAKMVLGLIDALKAARAEADKWEAAFKAMAAHR